MSAPIGILLVNLGTPDAPTRGAVYRYLRQFLTDGRVIDIPWLPRQLLVQGIIAPFRSGQSAKGYQKLWTDEGSPLKVYGEKLAKGVQSILGDGYAVELGMRYQNPSIESAIARLNARNIQKLVVLPLFPHYASASTGSVYEEVMRVLSKQQSVPHLRIIQSFHDYAPMIQVFADNARKFDLGSYDHFLFSYHGLPQRQMKKADRCNHCLNVEDCCQQFSEVNAACYSAQCYDTSRAIAAELGLKRSQYSVCFQSRLGRDPWIQPYTPVMLAERAKAGDKRLLVFSPAFVSDCLETIVEISEEYFEEFEQMCGGHLDLVPSLNDNPKWIQAVADLVR